MSRMRTLKPEACTSESLAEVDRAVRWTFAALWTHCDDEGRAVANLRLIKAAIYPLDDDVTIDLLERDLAELERVGALCFYEVDGRAYLHVPSWSEHQHPNRPQDSKLPPCPKTDHSRPIHTPVTEPSVNTHGALIPVVVGEGRVEGEGAVEGRVERAAPKRGNRLPDDWRPSDDDRVWTLQRLTPADAAVELEKFRNHWLAKTGRDATKLDWDRTWRNWVLNSRPANGRASPKASTADTRALDAHALAARLRSEETT